MGQAKIRKAEIDQLKASGRKSLSINFSGLMIAGFFYKADANGFSVSFGGPTIMGQKPFPIAALKVLINDGELMKNYESDFANEGQGFVDFLFEQINQMIVHGSMTEPDALLFSVNVFWLTERGFIKQDEYNGTQFAYSR